MSKIKVNRLENNSTANGGIDIDTSGHVQVDGLQMPTDGALSNRNLIQNGAMTVCQRPDSQVLTGTGQSTIYHIDQWKVAAFGVYPSGNYATSFHDWTSSPSALPGGSFLNAHKISTHQDIPVSATEARGIWTQQTIEGQNMALLGFGRANASTVTVSFWVKASKTGTFSVALKSSNSDLSYVTPVTISAADTWQYCTKTIPGPTTGTFNASAPFDNTSGLSLHFTWALDPTWIATATTDQWVAGNFVGTTTQSNMLSTTNDAVWLTGVQLEVGSKATPFEHESYSQTLAKCERYYQVIAQGADEALGMAAYYSGSRAFCTLQLRTTMRADPSLEIDGDATSYAIYRNGANDICNKPTFGERQQTRAIELDFNSNVSGTQGTAGFVRTADSSSNTGNLAFIAAKSEL